MATEYTLQDVAEHNTKNDVFLVIHDKVYDVTKFVDEHPGGEEVILDVGGQDATEAFEDVGHSDEARETLGPLLVGTLKRQPGEKGGPSKTGAVAPQAQTGAAGAFGAGVYLLVILGGAAAYFGYQYLQQQQEKLATAA